MTSTRVKFCGLTEPKDIDAAVAAGAAYVGFVFFPKSPRNLEPDAARELALSVPPGLAKVGLVVDADDATLARIMAAVPLDMLQLHGKETPERVAEIRQKYGVPVMKAVGVAGVDDLEAVDRYAKVADQLLIDAKPPKGGALPGGNGLAFDWRLITGRRWPVPWMLAGGLTADNVAQAVAMTGAQQVDVSSGIEDAPGRKSVAMMQAFAAALG
ncbi:MAG: phosphoribosylanthranilate isomerase [Arenibacterium sp.]